MFGSEHLHLSSLLVPRCEFFDGRNPSHSKDHIGYLPRLHASAAEKLEETGVESISDLDNFPLSGRQRRACTPVQTATPGSVRNRATASTFAKSTNFPKVTLSLPEPGLDER
jgi:hypothetical protein